MPNYDVEIQELFDAFEVIAQEKKKQAIKDFEQQLNETTNSLILEAVKHFSKRFRKSDKDDETDVDERYFYNENEVKRFLKLNKNPQVKIRIEYDKKIPNKVFCYIAYR